MVPIPKKSSKAAPKKTVKKVSAKTAGEKPLKTTAKASAKKTAKPAATANAAGAKTTEKKKVSRKSAVKLQPQVTHKEDATEAVLREMHPGTVEKNLTEVEAKKYGIETQQPPEMHGPRELDRIYGDTKLFLLVRDPEWIFAYWEIGPDTRQRFGIPKDQHDKNLMLRWYDVTGLPEFAGLNANRIMDIQINDMSISWYQKMPEPNRAWCADIGIMTPQGEFITICRSQIVQTPRNKVSEFMETQEWMHAEELRMRRIFEASGGMRVPSTLGSEALMGGASERLMKK